MKEKSETSINDQIKKLEDQLDSTIKKETAKEE